ncbi:MAG: hypothetical protein CMH61_00100 [Nanoarchaeota archaeon]|nr:hypothetical protein [Nanoarchaeota archaeon]HIJ11348.1 hypothetical protein [Candidatus Woesearchaeota archaeon]|tara:strand:+ start:208 stop:510 length:303 start_codon:yes stop_codon:yes gene_type:complete
MDESDRLYEESYAAAVENMKNDKNKLWKFLIVIFGPIAIFLIAIIIAFNTENTWYLAGVIIVGGLSAITFKWFLIRKARTGLIDMMEGAVEIMEREDNLK